MGHKKILITPLNWGLGHVTRCIPLIRALEKMDVEVILASDGVALDLLKAEFPHLTTLELPSYRITYASSNMVWNIATQLPRIVWAIKAEQIATERIVKEHQISGIISDNRYGCFSANAHSVILSHQLNLRIPNRLLQWGANQMLRHSLSKFKAVWVPDVEGAPNLSGELSHGRSAHPRTHYIGILTRMQAYTKDREFDVAVVLSGPEPQRTMLESRLLEQAMSLPQSFIFIQGKTQSQKHYFEGENIEVASYLTSKDLNDTLMASRVIICRSGYSSIMDLAALGKKAILIPTPGQTEQEYLADYFAEQQIFLTQHQDQLDLEGSIMKIGNTKGLPNTLFAKDAFMPVLEEWVARLGA